MTAERPTIAPAELERMARYLVGRRPSAALLARCDEAAGHLFSPPADPADAALLAFVRRHPWSLGPLDAAAALARPRGELRSRFLVVAAVLEASPEGAADFLPAEGDLSVVWRLPLLGAAAVLRTLAGLLLWPFAVRSRP
jgi:hypothetical protein